MFEAQPLHGVRQFDVDAEIVGIQLEQVAFEQAAIFIDVHGQRGDVPATSSFQCRYLIGSVWKSMKVALLASFRPPEP
jgi:hypothetical protein